MAGQRDMRRLRPLMRGPEVPGGGIAAPLAEARARGDATGLCRKVLGPINGKREHEPRERRRLEEVSESDSDDAFEEQMPRRPRLPQILGPINGKRQHGASGSCDAFGDETSKRPRLPQDAKKGKANKPQRDELRCSSVGEGRPRAPGQGAAGLSSRGPWSSALGQEGLDNLPSIAYEAARSLEAVMRGDKKAKSRRLIRDKSLDHAIAGSIPLRKLVNPENDLEFFLVWGEPEPCHVGVETVSFVLMHWQAINQAMHGGILGGSKDDADGRVKRWSMDDCPDKTMRVLSQKAGAPMDPSFREEVTLVDILPWSVSPLSNLGRKFNLKLFQQWRPDLEMPMVEHVAGAVRAATQASGSSPRVGVAMAKDALDFLEKVQIQGDLRDATLLDSLHPGAWHKGGFRQVQSTEQVTRSDLQLNRLAEFHGRTQTPGSETAIMRFVTNGRNGGLPCHEGMWIRECPEQTKKALATPGALGPFSRAGKAKIEEMQGVVRTGVAPVDTALKPASVQNAVDMKVISTTSTVPEGCKIDQASIDRFMASRAVVSNGAVNHESTNEQQAKEHKIVRMQKTFRTAAVTAEDPEEASAQRAVVDVQAPQRDGMPCIVHQGKGFHVMTMTKFCLDWAGLGCLIDKYTAGYRGARLCLSRSKDLAEVERRRDELHHLMQDARAGRGGREAAAGAVDRWISDDLRPKTGSGFHGVVRALSGGWMAIYRSGGKRVARTFPDAMAAARWREQSMPEFTGGEGKQRKKRNPPNRPWLGLGWQ